MINFMVFLISATCAVLMFNLYFKALAFKARARVDFQRWPTEGAKWELRWTKQARQVLVLAWLCVAFAVWSLVSWRW